MEPKTCPRCASPKTYIIKGLRETIANYHRCETCGRVWILPKNTPHEVGPRLAKADLRVASRRHARG